LPFFCGNVKDYGCFSVVNTKKTENGGDTAYEPEAIS